MGSYKHKKCKQVLDNCHLHFKKGQLLIVLFSNSDGITLVEVMHYLHMGYPQHSCYFHQFHTQHSHCLFQISLHGGI